MARFLLLIEKGERNYGAYAPDLPGCVATGKTLEEVTANMRAALRLRIEGMIEDKQPIPNPQTQATYIEIDLPI